MQKEDNDTSIPRVLLRIKGNNVGKGLRSTFKDFTEHLWNESAEGLRFIPLLQSPPPYSSPIYIQITLSGCPQLPHLSSDLGDLLRLFSSLETALKLSTWGFGEPTVRPHLPLTASFWASAYLRVDVPSLSVSLVLDPQILLVYWLLGPLSVNSSHAYGWLPLSWGRLPFLILPFSGFPPSLQFTALYGAVTSKGAMSTALYLQTGVNLTPALCHLELKTVNKAVTHWDIQRVFPKFGGD